MTFDKFLNKSIKILLSCVMVVSITIIILFVAPPVYAAGEFSNQPIPIKTSISYPTDSGAFLVGTNSAGYNFYCANYTGAVEMYAFVYSGSTSSQDNLCVCFDADAGSSQQFIYMSFGSTSGRTEYFSDRDTTYNLKYTGNISFNNSGVTYYAPHFDSLYDGLAAVRNYLDNGDAVSFSRTITIKPGYVAYVQTDGGTLDLVAQFHEYSRFSRPLWDNGVRISFNGGLVPTSGTVFNESFGSAVDWLKVASAPSNLLGQTMTGGRSYTAGLPEVGSNKCVVIYNPAYGNANTLVGGGTVDLGVYISATFSNVIDVTQYKLRADATVTYTSGAAISSGSPDDYNFAYSYIPSVNDPSDVVTDSDYRLLDLSDNTSGPAIDMNAGGYNGTSDYENENPEEAENGILGLLTRIFKFLSAPVSHIMSLFNAGGNFMAWLGQLWVWLPSDVGAILVDALIVLIVIGAIKFLWK